MRQHFRLALCATMIAAGCGGGDGGNRGTCDFDSVCDPGETCANCTDCACDDDQTCESGTCVATGPRCGDGRCDRSVRVPGEVPVEDCALCPQDCGCTGGQVCRSWKALGFPANACGGIAEDPTRYCGSACGPSNPVIDVIPGRWRRVEPFAGDTFNVIVDPSVPTCEISGHEAGDACVVSGGLELLAVLDGTRLFLRPPADIYLEGQTLEGGRRLEWNRGTTETGPFVHQVWVKE